MNWQAIAVHDNENIRGFFGNYRWLSNFHLCGIQYAGLTFPSTENAYMAAKCVSAHDREKFVHLAPKAAKELGRQVTLRKNWEEVKFDIMYELNKQKFEWHPDLRERLLATGDKYIEETNWWKDRIWGVCEGTGQNNLGKILMRIREELKSQ